MTAYIGHFYYRDNRLQAKKSLGGAVWPLPGVPVKVGYSVCRVRLAVSFCIVWFIICLLPSLTTAQNAELTIDQQYEQARNAAFNEGDYEKAREIAYRALERSPDYHDIRVFIARLYGWEGNFVRAREELRHVLERDADNREALIAIIDVDSRSGNNRQALEWSRSALKFYPSDQGFMLKQALLFRNMERYEEAEKLYRNILNDHPSSVDARQGLQTVRLKQMKNGATISYRHDRFNEVFDPWNFWEFQLSRQTGIGTIIGRLQHAERFGSNGVQFNLDAYPAITSGFYAYVSGGYSEATIYPRYRFGLSLYKSLPASLELEAGIRYLEFSVSKTTIYTASLTKYWGSYLFTARSYLVPSAEGSSQSAVLVTRRYFGDAETYLGLTGGFGSASADIQFAEDIRRLDSWSIAFDAQYPLTDRLSVGGNGGYDSEQFQNFNRNRFSMKLYLSYRF